LFLLVGLVSRLFSKERIGQQEFSLSIEACGLSPQGRFLDCCLQLHAAIMHWGLEIMCNEVGEKAKERRSEEVKE
jgi:hypothetical protein